MSDGLNTSSNLTKINKLKVADDETADPHTHHVNGINVCTREAYAQQLAERHFYQAIDAQDGRTAMKLIKRNPVLNSLISRTLNDEHPIDSYRFTQRDGKLTIAVVKSCTANSNCNEATTDIKQMKTVISELHNIVNQLVDRFNHNIGHSFLHNNPLYAILNLMIFVCLLEVLMLRSLQLNSVLFFVYVSWLPVCRRRYLMSRLLLFRVFC